MRLASDRRSVLKQKLCPTEALRCLAYGYGLNEKFTSSEYVAENLQGFWYAGASHHPSIPP